VRAARAQGSQSAAADGAAAASLVRTAIGEQRLDQLVPGLAGHPVRAGLHSHPFPVDAATVVADLDRQQAVLDDRTQQDRGSLRLSRPPTFARVLDPVIDRVVHGMDERGPERRPALRIQPDPLSSISTLTALPIWRASRLACSATRSNRRDTGSSATS